MTSRPRGPGDPWRTMSPAPRGPRSAAPPKEETPMPSDQATPMTTKAVALPATAGTLHKLAAAAVALPARPTAARWATLTLSDGRVDRDRDDIPPREAWASLPSSVPLLVSHDTGMLPVGRVERLHLDGDKLVGTARFPPASTSTAADEAWGLVRSGILDGVSIGFRPGTAEPNLHGGRTYRGCELLEASLVSLPSNTGTAS